MATIRYTSGGDYDPGNSSSAATNGTLLQDFDFSGHVHFYYGSFFSIDNHDDYIELMTTNGMGQLQRADNGIYIDVSENNDWCDITGGDKGDVIRTGSAYDEVYAGGGDDVVEGGDSGDYLDGELGNNTLSYEHSDAGVTVDLTTMSASGGDATNDMILNFSNIIGSGFDDVLNGDANANSLSGGGGNDFLRGGLGDDDMTGGLGNDRFLVDGMGDDVHETAGGGIDTIYTTVSYSLSNSEEVEGLRAYSGVTTGLTLTGNDLNNTINGGAGGDTITGGLGMDRLTGGAGNDTFAFNSTTETTTAARDVITDFVSGSDKLDLHTIDANTKLAGDQDFTFLGTGAFTRSAGQLHQVISGGSSYIEGDVDGNGTADFRIGLLNINATLNAGDFVL